MIIFYLISIAVPHIPEDNRLIYKIEGDALVYDYSAIEWPDLPFMQCYYRAFRPVNHYSAFLNMWIVIIKDFKSTSQKIELNSFFVHPESDP